MAGCVEAGRSLSLSNQYLNVRPRMTLICVDLCQAINLAASSLHICYILLCKERGVGEPVH